MQSTSLNLITGDKQYDLVNINPNKYKENMKLHIYIPCTYPFMIYICTHIYVNTGK